MGHSAGVRELWGENPTHPVTEGSELECSMRVIKEKGLQEAGGTRCFHLFYTVR